MNIYSNICALPNTDLSFNINGLNQDNYLVLLSMYPDLSLDDIQKIIINRPNQGYKNFDNLIDLTGLSIDRINNSFLIFKPEFIQIAYTFDLEGYIFNFFSVIDLKSRNNNIIWRSISL